MFNSLYIFIHKLRHNLTYKVLINTLYLWSIKSFILTKFDFIWVWLRFQDFYQGICSISLATYDWLQKTSCAQKWNTSISVSAPLMSWSLFYKRKQLVPVIPYISTIINIYNIGYERKLYMNWRKYYINLDITI